MSKTNCSGWCRYNNGQHIPCDRPATEDDGWCDSHRQAAATDPLGIEGYQAIQ